MSGWWWLGPAIGFFPIAFLIMSYLIGKEKGKGEWEIDDPPPILVSAFIGAILAAAWPITLVVLIGYLPHKAFLNLGEKSETHSTSD